MNNDILLKSLNEFLNKSDKEIYENLIKNIINTLKEWDITYKFTNTCLGYQSLKAPGDRYECLEFKTILNY